MIFSTRLASNTKNLYYMNKLPECEEFSCVHQDMMMKCFKFSSVPESITHMSLIRACCFLKTYIPRYFLFVRFQLSPIITLSAFYIQLHCDDTDWTDNV